MIENMTDGAWMLQHSLEPYADEDERLNDWVDNILAHVRWHMFQNQEEWLYMAGELGEGAVPKFKPNAREVMHNAIYREFGWVVAYMMDRLITEYRLGNVDLDDDLIADLRYEMGGYEDEEDTTYDEWEAEARKRIFKDYEEHLGTNETLRLAKSWWGEDWKPDWED